MNGEKIKIIEIKALRILEAFSGGGSWGAITPPNNMPYKRIVNKKMTRKHAMKVESGKIFSYNRNVIE